MSTHIVFNETPGGENVRDKFLMHPNEIYNKTI